MLARTKTIIRQAWIRWSLLPLYGKLGGRSFILVVAFGIAAFVLAWHNKLTNSFAAVVTALSGFHVGRAVMQDYNSRKQD